MNLLSILLFICFSFQLENEYKPENMHLKNYSELNSKEYDIIFTMTRSPERLDSKTYIMFYKQCYIVTVKFQLYTKLEEHCLNPENDMASISGVPFTNLLEHELKIMEGDDFFDFSFRLSHLVAHLFAIGHRMKKVSQDYYWLMVTLYNILRTGYTDGDPYTDILFKQGEEIKSKERQQRIQAKTNELTQKVESVSKSFKLINHPRLKEISSYSNLKIKNRIMKNIFSSIKHLFNGYSLSDAIERLIENDSLMQFMAIFSLMLNKNYQDVLGKKILSLQQRIPIRIISLFAHFCSKNKGTWTRVNFKFSEFSYAPERIIEALDHPYSPFITFDNKEAFDKFLYLYLASDPNEWNAVTKADVLRKSLAGSRSCTSTRIFTNLSSRPDIAALLIIHLRRFYPDQEIPDNLLLQWLATTRNMIFVEWLIGKMTDPLRFEHAVLLFLDKKYLFLSEEFAAKALKLIETGISKDFDYEDFIFLVKRSSAIDFKRVMSYAKNPSDFYMRILKKNNHWNLLGKKLRLFNNEQKLELLNASFNSFMSDQTNRDYNQLVDFKNYVNTIFMATKNVPKEPAIFFVHLCFIVREYPDSNTIPDNRITFDDLLAYFRKHQMNMDDRIALLDAMFGNFLNDAGTLKYFLDSLSLMDLKDKFIVHALFNHTDINFYDIYGPRLLTLFLLPRVGSNPDGVSSFFLKLVYKWKDNKLTEEIQSAVKEIVKGCGLRIIDLIDLKRNGIDLSLLEIIFEALVDVVPPVKMDSFSNRFKTLNNEKYVEAFRKFHAIKEDDLNELNKSLETVKEEQATEKEEQMTKKEEQMTESHEVEKETTSPTPSYKETFDNLLGKMVLDPSNRDTHLEQFCSLCQSNNLKEDFSMYTDLFSSIRLKLPSRTEECVQWFLFVCDRKGFPFPFNVFFSLMIDPESKAKYSSLFKATCKKTNVNPEFLLGLFARAASEDSQSSQKSLDLMFEIALDLGIEITFDSLFKQVVELLINHQETRDDYYKVLIMNFNRFKPKDFLSLSGLKTVQMKKQVNDKFKLCLSSGKYSKDQESVFNYGLYVVFFSNSFEVFLETKDKWLMDKKFVGEFVNVVLGVTDKSMINADFLLDLVIRAGIKEKEVSDLFAKNMTVFTNFGNIGKKKFATKLSDWFNAKQ